MHPTDNHNHDHTHDDDPGPDYLPSGDHVHLAARFDDLDHSARHHLDLHRTEYDISVDEYLNLGACHDDDCARLHVYVVPASDARAQDHDGGAHTDT